LSEYLIFLQITQLANDEAVKKISEPEPNEFRQKNRMALDPSQLTNIRNSVSVFSQLILSLFSFFFISKAKGSSQPLDDHDLVLATQFTFYEYAPSIFQRLRFIWGVDTEDYAKSLHPAQFLANVFLQSHFQFLPSTTRY